MGDQTVTLRIVGENGQLVASVRAAKAEIGGLGTASTRAGQQAQAGARGVDAIGAAAERTQRRASLLQGTLGQIKGLLAGYVGLQGIRELGRAADTYSDIDGKLRQVTNSERELAKARADTFRISQQYFQQWDATATLFGRVKQSTDQFGLSGQKVAQIVETVNAGLLVSRASGAEAASAMLQLSQAFGSGVLRGEEFNAVYEASPALMRLLADSMNVPIGQLRKMAEEGELTIGKLVQAFTGPGANQLQKNASDVPLTIGRAWQQAKNDALAYIGQQDQAIGASGSIASAISSLGKNLDTLLAVGTATAVFFSGRYLGSLIAVKAAKVQLTLQSIAAANAELREAQTANATAQARLRSAQSAISAWANSAAAQNRLGVAQAGAASAQLRLNAAQAAAPGIMARAAGGVRSLGASLLAFSGGPIGVTLIAVGALAMAFQNARQKAAELQSQMAGAQAATNGFRDAPSAEGYLDANKQEFAARARAQARAEELRGLLSRQVADPFGIGEKRRIELAQLEQQIATSTANIRKNNEIAMRESADGWKAAAGETAQFALAVSDADSKQKKVKDTVSDLAERQREFANEVARARAEVEGPAAAAQENYKQRLAEIDAQMRAVNGSEQQAGVLRDAARKQRDEAIQQINQEAEALRQRQNIIGQVHAEMEEEIYLSGLSSEARRVEETVIRAVNAAKAAEKPLNAQEIADLRSYVTASDAMIQAREDQARAIDDLKGAVAGAAQSGIRAFADWFGRGFKGAKDLWKQLKDVFKRGVSDVIATLLDASFAGPIKNWASQIASGLSGGLSGAGAQGSFGGGIGQLFSGAMNSLTSFFGRFFGRGGAAASSIESAVASGTGTAMDGWFALAKSQGIASQAGMLGGIMPTGGGASGLASAFGGVGAFALPLAGAALGWSQGGDTPGKVAGGLAGGALAADLIAGQMLGGALLGPIGWVALAAMVVNKVAGGKLFGTKATTESGSQSFGISESGAIGSESVTTVRQKSFFRGREWKTTTTGLSGEAMAAVQELFDSLKQTVTQASQQLGVEIPDLVGGTFKREFDAKGNLTREFGTIAGRVYNEAQEAFASRLVGENLLNVAKQAGSAAELEQLANAYRATGVELQSFAAFALAVQEDLRNANGVWKQADGDGVMTRIVQYVEGLANAGEALADAYARVQQTISAYGDLIGGVRTQLATRGLNQYQKAQLDVELAYRGQVKQANELAKALGLSGARAEDLAAIEQLRALNMADLAEQYRAQQVAQNRNFIEDLELSDLSPLRDDQKLARAMELLRTAASANDQGRAQKLAEQVLGFGRDLYASGMDYNNLFAQVTGILDSIQPQTMEELQGLTNEQLGSLAGLVDGLPSRIAQELAKVLVPTPPPATVNPALPPAPVPSPGPVPPGGGGGGGGGYDEIPRCVAVEMVMDNGLSAGAVQSGHRFETHDPMEGFTRKALRVAGAPVLQPCIRIVTETGAALVCSRSTPFTDPDAPADLPEFTTLAPDMLGKRVWVRMLGVVTQDTVVKVEDAGSRNVVPLDFGGRSFPAGEAREALIYSHNMQKVGSDISALVPLMAGSLQGIQKLVSIEESRNLAALNDGSRTGGWM